MGEQRHIGGNMYDYKDEQGVNVHKYTGAFDELFGMDEGALPYRSLQFEWHHEDIDSLQPYPVTGISAG